MSSFLSASAVPLPANHTFARERCFGPSFFCCFASGSTEGRLEATRLLAAVLLPPWLLLLLLSSTGTRVIR